MHAMALSIFLAGADARAQAPPAGGPKAGSDYSKEAFVIEKLHTVASFENDGTSNRTTTSAVRVQSEAGVQHWGILSAGYSSANERVEIGYVRVRKGDGTVVETPGDSVQDVTSEIMRVAPMYSDYHEKHVAVKGLGVGDMLEYQITVRLHTPLIPGQFWFAYDFEKASIALDEEVEVNVPGEGAVKVKSPELKPAITETGNRRIYTWKTANHEAKKNDEPRREFPPPSILLSTFKSWEELGRWWNGLEQQAVTPTPEIQAKAAELTRGAATREEEVRALYNYVATGFRYISISFGMGRYQPHAADEVLKNEYGDCKDKHTLLASLLEAVGIEAYPVLMNSSRHIDSDVPSPGQFDHVITAVPETPHASKLIWLDTTTEVAPFGFLAFVLREKQALVIPGAAQPLLVTTPADPPFKPFRRFEIEAKLNESGVLEGEMQRSFRGDTEVLLRMLFRQVPQSQWKDLVQDLTQGAGFAGEVSEVEVGSPEATGEPFHFTNKYTRKDYPDWANRRISPPLGFVGFAPIKDDEKRTLPILLGGREEITGIAKVELPKGYAPRLLPAVDLARDFAEYHSSYAFRDGVFIAEARLIIEKSEVPLSALDDYKSFQKAVSNDRDQYTELITGPQALLAPSPSFNAEATSLVQEAREAFQRRDMDGASDALERALKLDGQYKDAWSMLGALRLAQGRTNEGLAALRKAIEVDPKDTRTYKILGLAYMGMRRPEEAIPVWRDLLKQDPQDGDAHANLGKVLLSLKRYGQAVPDLEAAVALSRPNVSLKMALGEAYIGAGKNDQAVATLTKTAEAALEPRIWNNVAYELADHNLGLQGAQHYAEKAVKSVEDDAAQVHLDKLEVADVDRMTELATFWDTLGWVYFREGDLARAQRFLEAAWNLEQIQVIGEHLATIYEKEGKKAAANHQRALAGELPQSGGSAPFLRRPNGSLALPQAGQKTPLEEVQDMRRTKLGRLSSKPGSAEFFVLLAPGGKVEDVKFISGAEQIRPLSKVVASLKFKAPLPDESPVKLVRRGVLVCEGGNLGCDFTLFTVESVHSIE
jgi:tetratricopeptide (TPR) repeat protein